MDGKKVAFFDFDGVIADSFSVAFGVSKTIYPPLEKEEYIRKFDGNINEAVAESRVQEGYRADIDFFKEYGPLLFKCPLFPGIKEVLEQISKDFLLVIVSSTTTDLIVQYLKLNNIGSYFAEVVGNDIHASKIKKIEMVVSKYGIIPSDCFFVTDTLGDIKEAHHAGVKTIAVTWGYQPKESLERGSPFAIVNTTKELFDALY